MANAESESKRQYMANFVKGRATAAPAQQRGAFSTRLLFAIFAAVLYTAFSTKAADTLSWRTNQNGVSADIQSGRLVPVLEDVAQATKWHVFLEPGVTRTVSAKFKNQPVGEALHLLLGELNYALVPETNGPSKLFVFRTAQKNATQLIHPADGEAGTR